MSFIKHHKKFVALFVVLSFLYLVEISYLPLRAEPAPAKAPVSMNGDDQAPGSIETEGGGYVHKKKSSPIIPIIIGVVVLGAVAAVLILVVFKSKNDLAGVWRIQEAYPSVGLTYTANFTFTATEKRKSGTYSSTDGDHGNWTQDGKTVHIVSAHFTAMVYNGTFQSKKEITGTCSYQSVGGSTISGTWTGTQVSSASIEGAPASTPVNVDISKQKKVNLH